MCLLFHHPLWVSLSFNRFFSSPFYSDIITSLFPYILLLCFLVFVVENIVNMPAKRINNSDVGILCHVWYLKTHIFHEFNRHNPNLILLRDSYGCREGYVHSGREPFGASAKGSTNESYKGMKRQTLVTLIWRTRLSVFFPLSKLTQIWMLL